MERPLLLDLFCCAGGAAKGYDEAGFDVFGVDMVYQPNYPYPMLVADALKLPASFLREFDAIHASPPCQAYSDLAAVNGNAHKWPKLVPDVREMLVRSGRPYVIENVEGAPLRDYVVLCGTMFDELRVLRHRLFESNIMIMVPPHAPHPLCHTLDKRKAHYGKTDEWTDYVQVTGGGNCSVAAARDAMGIPWMTKKEINEAIPPAYTRWIGKFLMKEVQVADRRSMRELLMEYFRAHKDEVVESRQLQELVGPDRTEWGRRVRELREHGWPIDTHQHSAELSPGQYRMSGDPPEGGGYKFTRRVSERQRMRIMARNGFTCQACGAGPGDKTDAGAHVRLQVDHIEAHHHGGGDDDSNLRVLCQECNRGMKHLGPPPSDFNRTIAHVRSSTVDVQRRVFETLKRKFEETR